MDIINQCRVYKGRGTNSQWDGRRVGHMRCIKEFIACSWFWEPVNGTSLPTLLAIHNSFHKYTVRHAISKNANIRIDIMWKTTVVVIEIMLYHFQTLVNTVCALFKK